MPRALCQSVTVAVKIAGQEILPADGWVLDEARVVDKLSQPAGCELTYSSAPWGARRLLSLLAVGQSLEVALVDGRILFSGEITAVEYAYAPNGAQTVRVRAYTILHRLQKRQPMRAFVEVGLDDLANELVNPLGLIVSGETSPVIWRRLIQSGQSDLDILCQQSRACGLYFRLRGADFQFLSLQGVDEPIELTWGDSLLETEIEVNADHCCRSVETQGWNPTTGRCHKGRAGRARCGRETRAGAPPEAVNGSGDHFLAGRNVENERAAEQFSQAALDAQTAREVTVRGVAHGNADLCPGAIIKITGVAPIVEGRYVVTHVVHSIVSENSFTTEFSTRPPSEPLETPTLIALPGRVSNVDDPEHLGRIQVTLPTCQDLQTDWIPLLTPGAGPAKGLVMTPNVGDLVLTISWDRDFAQAVVIGGLFGADGAFDAGIEGGRSQRFTLRTASGHCLQFDDSDKSIRLRDAGGSSLEFKPDGVWLSAAGDLNIAAPGRTILIRGKNINFEEA